MKSKKINIDLKQVFELAKLHCTNKEIACVLGVSEALITHKYTEIITKGREAGKQRLRQLQWKSAEAGNVTI